jgi:hypothetical protein
MVKIFGTSLLSNSLKPCLIHSPPWLKTLRSFIRPGDRPPSKAGTANTPCNFSLSYKISMLATVSLTSSLDHICWCLSCFRKRLWCGCDWFLPSTFYSNFYPMPSFLTRSRGSMRLITAWLWCASYPVSICSTIHLASASLLHNSWDFLYPKVNSRSSNLILHSWYWDKVNTIIISKIISASDVIQVLPSLVNFITSLYNYHYFYVFVSFTTLEQAHLFPSRLSSLLNCQSIWPAISVHSTYTSWSYIYLPLTMVLIHPALLFVHS